MRTVLAFVMVVLLLPVMAFAEEPTSAKKIYLEVKGGQYKPTGEFAVEPSPNGSSIEVAAGYRFSRYFAAEIGYGLLRADGDVVDIVFLHPTLGTTVLSDGEVTVKATPLLATAKFMLPFEQGFFYLGGGVGRYKTELTYEYKFTDSLSNTGQRKFRDTDTVSGWHYQLGTILDFGKRWTVGVEYKEIKTDEAEYEDEILGLTFGSSTKLSGRIISALAQVRF